MLKSIRIEDNLNFKQLNQLIIDSPDYKYTQHGDKIDVDIDPYESVQLQDLVRNLILL